MTGTPYHASKTSPLIEMYKDFLEDWLSTWVQSDTLAAADVQKTAVITLFCLFEFLRVQHRHSRPSLLGTFLWPAPMPRSTGVTCIFSSSAWTSCQRSEVHIWWGNRWLPRPPSYSTGYWTITRASWGHLSISTTTECQSLEWVSRHGKFLSQIHTKHHRPYGYFLFHVKGQDFQWTTEHQSAFDATKHALARQPYSTTPAPQLPLASPSTHLTWLSEVFSSSSLMATGSR